MTRQTASDKFSTSNLSKSNKSIDSWHSSADDIHDTTAILVSTIGATFSVFVLWGLSASLPVLCIFSVVYGFFGVMVLVPWVAALADPFDGSGMSMFTASLVLGIMILPTIITVSKTSLDAVPGSYYEGSLALGATHERSVFTIMLPAAKSGVLSAVILGVGRAIGETMAVIMVAGNQPIMPSGLFEGLRTMTSNIVLEMGYATGLHRQALIATGVVLFVFILLINLCFSLVKGGKKDA